MSDTYEKTSSQRIKLKSPDNNGELPTGKTTHVEKTMTDSCITQNNMCIENSRLFHEEDVLWISCMCLLSSVCGICIIILHVVS
jgi:hypothetical protein